jgi:acetyl-CoA C-acetyltransferase
VAAEDVDEVIMGCVLPAGQGQAPARQAALGAGLPLAAGCTTINKMCGSGMKAAMLAHDLLLAGSASVMVAGGMESMSNSPYLIPKARRPAAGAWRNQGPHVSGRAGRCLRQGQADGRVCRKLCR